MSFSLPAYLARVGLTEATLAADHASLTAVMAAQMRAIAFENVDVVLGKTVSMDTGPLVAKLVGGRRGGYCFEQNQILRLALVALGFEVAPLLCRVRWGKSSDEADPAPTHFALQVSAPATGSVGSGAVSRPTWLADVGFAGTNSIAPVALGLTEPQQLPEGLFRTVDRPDGHTELQLQLRGGGAWRPLYTWRTNEPAPEPDLELSNWWSCTKPGARFTSQFFAARTVGEERHHLLNDAYVIRQPDGAAETTPVVSKAQLCGLLEDVFGITLPTDTEGIDRYLGRAGM